LEVGQPHDLFVEVGRDDWAERPQVCQAHLYPQNHVQVVV
jgi:hypothetical protein